MNSFIDDLKNAFNRSDNNLYKLIAINIVIFLISAIVYVIAIASKNEFIFEIFYENVALPSTPLLFLFKPWTIFTYMFIHEMPGLLHILFNMMVLYWFGQLIMEYLGSKRVLSLYILGGLAGAILYLILTNTLPLFSGRSFSLIGASGAVYAIVVAAATLLPEYTFFLLFLGPVKIKYIAAFYVLGSFLGSVGGNAGGAIAHLGGALLGYIFITQLRKGNDIGKPVSAVFDGVAGLFKKKSKIKVSYNKGKYAKTTASKSSSYNSKPNTSNNSNTIDQDEIDAILDKISQSGYEKLTIEEKQKLFKASQRK